MNKAEKYIDDVLNGNIICGKDVRLAVERHIKDLNQAKELGLYFDRTAAEIAIQTIQLIPHTSGKWANQPFQLQPWQAFVLWCTYGWKRLDTNERRFRKVYIKIARKNGKTEFLSAIGMMDMSLFGIEGGEIFWGATKKEQAQIGLKRQMTMAKKLRARSKYFRKNFTVNSKRVINKANNMFADKIGRDSNTEDGHLVWRGYIDEYHAHKTTDIVDILESGMVAFNGSAIWIITTAGYNKASVCKHFEDNCKQVLRGHKTNDGLFAMIFDLDEGDDWEDSKNWYKANPGLGISPTIESLRQIYQNALTEGAAKRVDFLTKNLNKWTNSEITWIEPEIWAKSGAASPVTIEDLKGLDAYGGLDLASTKDITAFVLVVPLENEKYGIVCRFWIPEDTARQRAKEDGVKYLEWIDEGWIMTTPGNVIDYNYIFDEIQRLRKLYNIVAVNYDPWNSSQLVNELEESGQKMYPIRQGYSMSPPAKEFERKTRRGEYIHFQNPVLAWMIDNVMAVIDGNENIKLDKSKSGDKIDGVVAAVMAEAAWMSLKEEKIISIYEKLAQQNK